MKVQEINQILDEAKANPEVLATDRYIEAQLQRLGLLSISQQMGPNCNLSCPHCYKNFGRNRKGFPKLKTVQKTLEEAVESEFLQISLTDGEPIRHENKKLMKLFAEYSSKLPVAIMTNAVFAYSEKNTLNWMNFLKDNGLELKNNPSLFNISTGPTYKVHWHNYARFNWALKQVFPDADFGKILMYQYLGYGNLEGEKDNISLISRCISYYFNEKRKAIEIDENNNKYIPTGKTPILLGYRLCEPEGRAKQMKKHFDLLPSRKLREFTVETTTFSVKEWEFLVIDWRGNVGFGVSLRCGGIGRVYGNVNSEHLFKIWKKIDNDEIYQANKLGGARFLYHLAQEINPDFVVTGRINCDVCKEISSSYELVNNIRQKLKREGIIKEYKEYIDQRGIPTLESIN